MDDALSRLAHTAHLLSQQKAPSCVSGTQQWLVALRQSQLSQQQQQPQRQQPQKLGASPPVQPLADGRQTEAVQRGRQQQQVEEGRIMLVPRTGADGGCVDSKAGVTDTATNHAESEGGQGASLAATATWRDATASGHSNATAAACERAARSESVAAAGPAEGSSDGSGGAAVDDSSENDDDYEELDFERLRPPRRAGSPAGEGLAGRGSKRAVRRRPAQFWAPFNDWWRMELEQTGKRPGPAAVEAWHAAHASRVWGADAPRLDEARTHAKCLRSVGSIRDYFRTYRARKKARQEEPVVKEPAAAAAAQRSAAAAAAPANGGAAAAAAAAAAVPSAADADAGMRQLAALSALLPRLSALAPLQLAAALHAANGAVPGVACQRPTAPDAAPAKGGPLTAPATTAGAASTAAAAAPFVRRTLPALDLLAEGAGSHMESGPASQSMAQAKQTVTTSSGGGPVCPPPGLGSGGGRPSGSGSGAAAAPVPVVTTSSAQGAARTEAGHGGGHGGGHDSDPAPAVTLHHGGELSFPRAPAASAAASSARAALGHQRSAREGPFAFTLNLSGSTVATGAPGRPAPGPWPWSGAGGRPGAQQPGPGGEPAGPPQQAVLLSGMLPQQLLAAFPGMDGAAVVHIRPRGAAPGAPSPPAKLLSFQHQQLRHGHGEDLRSQEQHQKALSTEEPHHTHVRCLPPAGRPAGPQELDLLGQRADAAGAMTGGLHPRPQSHPPLKAPWPSQNAECNAEAITADAAPPEMPRSSPGAPPAAAPADAGNPGPRPAAAPPGAPFEMQGDAPAPAVTSARHAPPPPQQQAQRQAPEPPPPPLQKQMRQQQQRRFPVAAEAAAAATASPVLAGPAPAHVGVPVPSLRWLLHQPDEGVEAAVRGLPAEALAGLLVRAVGEVKRRRASEGRLMDELATLLEQQGGLEAQLHAQRVETARLYRSLVALRDGRGSSGGGGSFSSGSSEPWGAYGAAVPSGGAGAGGHWRGGGPSAAVAAHPAPGAPPNTQPLPTAPRAQWPGPPGLLRRVPSTGAGRDGGAGQGRGGGGGWMAAPDAALPAVRRVRVPAPVAATAAASGAAHCWPGSRSGSGVSQARRCGSDVKAPSAAGSQPHMHMHMHQAAQQHHGAPHGAQAPAAAVPAAVLGFLTRPGACGSAVCAAQGPAVSSAAAADRAASGPGEQGVPRECEGRDGEAREPPHSPRQTML